MPYYSERMTAMGRWCPQITPDAPTDTTSDGAKIKVRDVTLIPPELEGYPISVIQWGLRERADYAARLAAEAACDADGFVTIHPPRAAATGIGE